MKVKFLFAIFFVSLSSSLFGQAFTPGNLVVFKVTGITDSSKPISLLQYNTTTANQTSPLTTINLPSTGAQPITVSGTATSEGQMCLDEEQTHLIIAGYDAIAGVASIATTSSASYYRELFTVNPSGAASLAWAANVFSGNNIRSGTANGADYYASGANTGIIMNGTTVISSTVPDTRVIHVYNGQLYFVTGSGASRGLWKVGPGVPVTASASSPVINTGAHGSAYGYSISPDSKTVYLADDTSGILKYVMTGGSYVFTSTVTATPCRGITVDYSSIPFTIYATTAASPGNSLVKIVDNGATYPATTLAVTPATGSFRGVAFVPASYASIKGTDTVCSGSHSKIIFYGNPGAAINYTVNGSAASLILNNGGTDTLNPLMTAGINDTVITYSLVSISTSVGTFSEMGSAVITVMPSSPAPVSGPDSVCVGASVTLTDATTGGSWTTSSSATASISGGTVTGASAGSAIITYSLTNACGVITATSAITVGPLPDAGTITGAATVCTGSATTLTDTATGGTWSSSDAGIASVSAGVVTGVAAGTATITCSVANSCGTAITNATVTVNPLPDAGTITGTPAVCAGAATTLTAGAAGGMWESSNTATATVSGGVTTGVSAGSATISYYVTNGCGTATATLTVMVSPLPYTGAIMGAATVCAGSSTAFSSSVSGGMWSSGDTAIATVSAGGGTVTGVSAGTAIISYSISNSCGTANAAVMITVGPLPVAGAITGDPMVCTGGTTILANAAAGGLWSSSNTAIATVTGGTVSGVSAGSAIITYSVTNTCATATAVKTVAVNSLANAGSIAGPSILCAGTSVTLTDGATGGIWSSSNTGVATVSGGVVTPLSAGSAAITYTVTNSCNTAVAARLITVNPLPVAGNITGAATLCPGFTTTLTDAAPGGAWSSANAAVATVAGGLVSSVSAGTAVISYSVTNSCGTAVAATTVTVNPLPVAGAITGSPTVCTGFTAALADGGAGGAWSSSNAAIAAVSGGIVSGISAGSATITYSVTNSCGTARATVTVTVNLTPVASAISGPASVCVAAAITLADPVAGGAWTSSNMAIATVSGGIVAGVSGGSATISYTIANGCGTVTAIREINVVPLPGAGVMMGAAMLCQGASATLTDMVAGGVWSSSNTGVAQVSGGLVTAVAAGTATISYAVANSCGTAVATETITVNALPYPGMITGGAAVCQGSALTLTDAAAGGVWSSSNTTIATVSGGMVTGVSAGSAIITCAVANLCGTAVSTRAITVSPLPDAGTIIGPATECQGASIALADGIAGGIWSSSNPAIATVAAGLVTGVSAGSATVTYAVTNGCGTAITTIPFLVNPIPVSGAIAGPATVCQGAVDTLTGTVPGGAWGSGNTLVASVSAGVVTGVSAGSAIITYAVSNGCGSATDSLVISVGPQPVAGAITGVRNVCKGLMTNLSDAASGGLWSSSNTTIATIAAGLVTGVSAGSAIITYAVTNSCGTASDTAIITVISSPVVGPVTGVMQVCVGSSTTLTDTVSGGVWGTIGAVNATVSNGIVTGISPGTTTITYAVINSCGTALASSVVVTYGMPGAGTITGNTTICPGSVVTLSASITGGIWAAVNTNASVVDGIVTAISTGNDTITYQVANICGTATAEIAITIIPDPVVRIVTHPANSFCANTLFQNFGASGAQGPGTQFTWSVYNGSLYALSANRQFCLVNFYDPGISIVTLSVTTWSNGCTSADSFVAHTGTQELPMPGVVYYYPMLVCLDNTANGYQWGYDDAITLDSTILPGEINQNYYNNDLDLLHKNYWVMAAYDGCYQKSYYNAPEKVPVVSGPGFKFSAFPNPAHDVLSITVKGAGNGGVTVTLFNALGQRQMTQAIDNGATELNISELPQGIYRLAFTKNGLQIGSATVAKD